MRYFTFLASIALIANSANADQPVSFSREILPILSDNCFQCHGPDANAREAELRLDQQASALRTEDPVIVPGHSGDSEVMRRILSNAADEVMPPADSNRQLTPQQIALLKRWIDEGAVWGQHWAYEKPERPQLPTVNNTTWVRNPIDHFILQQLEDEHLAPANEADKVTLIRRVTLDLTGLPPTPAEVDTFLADDSPEAYAVVVERLLASPRFGERMVWDWLEAARYADTNGYQGDPTRPMFYWRDWAIAAFNNNMPFDQFTIEQLAGDLLPNPTQQQLIATGFHRNHMINGEGGRIAEESRVDYVQDRVESTGTIWMGLTLNCCRCHDHKFDPIAQREYYQLSAYFNSIDETGRNDARGLAHPIMTLFTPEQRERLEVLRMAEKAAGKDEAEAARKQREKFEQSLPKTMVMRERDQPRDTFILIRGAYDNYGEKVEHGVPAVLPPMPDNAPNNRLALARWLVSPEHPLTARVSVNRYWQMLLGVGIVETVEDFGIQGERPSHPQLLDWLACEFVTPTLRAPTKGTRTLPQTANSDTSPQTGWDVKHIIRLIVNSATYRQSSRITPELLERDPDNRRLARGPRYRLPSWMIRDQALAASGLLVEHVGGPPVKGYQPPGVWADATFGKIRYQQDDGAALYRRSLYQFWRRIVGPTVFFDAANRQACQVRLARTNTPLHALTTLNDVTFVEAARNLAQRVLLAKDLDDRQRIQFAFRLCTARTPRARESELLLARLETLRTQYLGNPSAAQELITVGESKANPNIDSIELAAYTGVATIMLNLDETITKE